MIRVGVIGIDGHGRSFTTALNGATGGVPYIQGAGVTMVWAPDRGEASTFAAELGVGQVVDRPNEMVGEIDLALILHDADDGASHARLARPFLAAGKPVFVDRPMTPDLRETVELVMYAQRHGAPLMTGSALRYATEVSDLTARLPALGALSAVMVTGPGHWWYYGLHSVELVRATIGGKVRWIHRHVLGNRDVVILSTETGPTIVVTLLRDVPDRFHLMVHGVEGIETMKVRDHWLQGRDAGPHTFRTRLMAAAVEMARSGRQPVPSGELIEDLAILAAGRRSEDRGGPVFLTELYQEAGLEGTVSRLVGG